MSFIKDKSISTINETRKEAVSQCLSEPPLLLNFSTLQVPNLRSSSSTSPLMQTITNKINEGQSLTIELEKDLLDMMDLVKNNKSSQGLDGKLKSLLDTTSKSLRNSRDVSSNMQIRVLYQFLLEYQKLHENTAKPTLVKRPVQPRPTAKKSITPVRSTKNDKSETFSSVSSLKSSK